MVVKTIVVVLMKVVKVTLNNVKLWGSEWVRW